MEDNVIKPFYIEYGLEPKLYKDYKVEELNFSVRLTKRLLNNGIHTVSDLLKSDINRLYEIKGFGKGCIDELLEYLANIKYNNVENSVNKMELKSDELKPFYANIRQRNFEFLNTIELSNDSSKRIAFIKEGIELIDKSLIDACFDADNGVVEILNMLINFINEEKYKEECREYIREISFERTEYKVVLLITAFAKTEEIKMSLLSGVETDAESLSEYILRNTSKMEKKSSIFIQFLNWCKYDVQNEINLFFEDLYKDTRLEFLLTERTKGQTLEQIGNNLCITRERVRQIEKKATQKFGVWQKNNRILNKIFVDNHETVALSSSELENFIRPYGSVFVYLLKNNDDNDIIYDEQLDMFLADDNSLLDKIQCYVESLPKTLNEKKALMYINEAECKYEYPAKMIRSVIEENYKRTGDTYHRIRLTLTNMYSYIMKKYYPNGMHIYDDNEIWNFKKFVMQEYGIELSSTNRAIVAILGRIGILCGRGIYRINDRDFISKKLANKIYSYIENSEIPIFMTNTIFNVFEEELLEEGVTNKYFLQGILRNLYDDQWYFRRDYISKDESTTTVYTEIVNFIKKSKYPVSKKEICQAFPGVTEIVINASISDSEIINLFGEYLYGGKLKLENYDLHYLSNVIDSFFEKKEVWHCKKIYEYVMKDNPTLLTNNYIDMPFRMYSLLEYYFREEYNFSRPFIAKQNAKIERVYDILKEMVEDFEQIEISYILSFSRNNYHQINNILEFVNECNDTHLLMNDKEIISIKAIGIDKRIANEVENFIIEEITDTIAISHLQCIHKFPKLKIEWNEWLIYSVIKKWSQKLEVKASASQFRQSIPLIAPKGRLIVSDEIVLESAGKIVIPDDLSDIDNLIGDYLFDSMGGK